MHQESGAGTAHHQQTSAYIPSCPFTGTQNVKHVFEVRDHAVSGESFQIYESSDIGLRFTHPMPDAQEIGKYYDSEDYISHSNTNTGLIARLYQMARNFTLRSKHAKVVRSTGMKKGKLLDFGCGTGEFAHFMIRSGWEVDGIEPGEKAARFAADQYGIEVHKSLQELDTTGKFDAITAWHVLEHVHHPGDVMDHFKKLLKPGGTIFLALPNHQSFDARFYKEVWAGYDVPRHLFHFSPASVGHLAGDHGFTIIKTYHMWLDAFYVSLLSEKYLKTGFAGYPGAFVVGLWSNFCALFNKQKCSSLIYTLRVN